MIVGRYVVYGLVGASLIAAIVLSCWSRLPSSFVIPTLDQEYDMMAANDVHEIQIQLDKTMVLSHPAFSSSANHLTDNVQHSDGAKDELIREVKYRRFLQKRDFVESENRNVFIFGAVVSNSSDTSAWDVCKVYGEWHNSEVSESTTSCCLRYQDGTTRKTEVRTFGKTWLSNSNITLHPWHVTCSNTGQVDNLTLAWVSIVRGSNVCSDNATMYIRPFFALKKPKGYLVITTKTAYEKLDPGLIVNQFETFRHIGVDKVVTYVEDTLWDNAMKVLDYYASVGLLEMYAYKLADYDKHPRNILQQDTQIYADQTTVMRDAIERHFGATYFGVMDFDEFLLPAGNMSLTQVLLKADTMYPKASSFVFKNQHFFTDIVNSSCDNECAIFSRYFYTPNQPLNYIHRKMIHHPSRIDTGTLYSHNTKAQSGYVEISCPENLAFIRHYGSCKRKFESSICMDRKSWVFSSSAEKWAEGTLARNIASTIKLLDL